MVHHVFDSVGSDPAVFQALSQVEWAWVLMKAEEVLQSKTVDITNTMSSATVLKASYLFYIPCYITTFSFALSCFLSHDLVSCALLCSFNWHWFMFTSLFIDIVIVYCAILSFCFCTRSAPSCSAYSNNQGTFGNVFALL